MKNISRKKFLSRLGFGLVSIPLTIKGISAATMSNSTKNETDCGYTDAATEGPFFVKNTAKAVNINFTNLPGNPMNVSGAIYGDTEGNVLVPNAKIEIWHCDDEGVYHPTGNGNISKYKNTQIALRGYVISDKNGKYSFRSIVPGLYSGRRRHIHYKISAKGFKTLTTQSYWLSEKGDQRSQIDRTDRNTEDCRYIDFKKQKNGLHEGEFNIFLEKK